MVFAHLEFRCHQERPGKIRSFKTTAATMQRRGGGDVQVAADGIISLSLHTPTPFTPPFPALADDVSVFQHFFRGIFLWFDPPICVRMAER